MNEKYGYSPEKFYPISASEEDLVCVVLRPGQEFPAYSDKQKIINLSLELPLLGTTEEPTDMNAAVGDEAYLRTMI